MNRRMTGSCVAAFLAGALAALGLAHAFARAVHAAPADAALDVIRITPAQHRALDAAHATDRWLDDEILFREALRRGAVYDDLIVRRELQRRARAALLEEKPLPRPDDAALQAYLDAHADRYQAPARWSFQQVYLSRARHGARLDADAQALGAKLNAVPESELVLGELGDPFPAGSDFSELTAVQVEADFGATVARALAQCAIGRWCGPVISPLGAHWLRVTRTAPARTLRLDEVRARLRSDLLDQERQQALRQSLDALRSRYRIVDDPAAPRAGAWRTADSDEAIP
ncbi:MAG: peptidylprolyl isomerase [Sinobacteraceae bacterium]|nr:peptidylprolyl isomerase [Nevskiaceae bacterium]